MTVQHRTHTTIVHAKNHKELTLLQEENGRLREELAAAEGRVVELETAYNWLVQGQIRLAGEVAELERECDEERRAHDRIGSILLPLVDSADGTSVSAAQKAAEEIKALREENARLKALVSEYEWNENWRVSIGNGKDAMMREQVTALLVSRAAAKELP
jgi:hypothetical protein